MEPKHFLKATYVLSLLFFFQVSFAGANIMGQVVDTANNNKPLDGIAVMLESHGNVLSYYTNEHGYYYASNIPAGEYTVGFVNNKTTYKATVKVVNDETRELNFMVNGVREIETVVVTAVNKNPLFKIDAPDVIPVTTLQAKNAGINDIVHMAELLPGVVVQGNDVYVHGARAGSVAYYIDDCLVMGTPNIPLCGLDTYRAYTGFIPAKYGDTTGGVIVMETKSYFGR
jgi:hypothetical protein